MNAIVDGIERRFLDYLELLAFLIRERQQGRRAKVSWVERTRW